MKKILFISLLSLFVLSFIETNSFAELQIKNAEPDIDQNIEKGIGLTSDNVLNDKHEQNTETESNDENKNEDNGEGIGIKILDDINL